MASIVAELAKWVEANEVNVRESGIELDARFPEEKSGYSWVASVGLEYEGVLVSYSVWESSIFRTELIVVNASGQTILANETVPEDADSVLRELDAIVRLLLDNFYARAEPDPNIIGHVRVESISKGILRDIFHLSYIWFFAICTFALMAWYYQ